MADAELQLITGHARRETLAIYQHVALDQDLEQEVPGLDEERRGCERRWETGKSDSGDRRPISFSSPL